MEFLFFFVSKKKTQKKKIDSISNISQFCKSTKNKKYLIFSFFQFSEFLSDLKKIVKNQGLNFFTQRTLMCDFEKNNFSATKNSLFFEKDFVLP